MDIFSYLIDIIYPPRCFVCHQFLRQEKAEGEDQRIPFCQACLEDFKGLTSPSCPVCGRSFVSEVEEDHLCEDCLKKRPFYDAIGAPYAYQGSLVQAIHQFKYQGKSHLANGLGPLLGSFAKRWVGEAGDCVMMPVPLHPKRLRERGFNQSLFLARHVAPLLETELDFLTLRRRRYTKPQTDLRFDERRKNVRNAFEVTNKRGIKGRDVILVDDVATTGHTLNECARVLKRSGAKRVWGLVLARTSGQ